MVDPCSGYEAYLDEVAIIRLRSAMRELKTAARRYRATEVKKGRATDKQIIALIQMGLTANEIRARLGISAYHTRIARLRPLAELPPAEAGLTEEPYDAVP